MAYFRFRRSTEVKVRFTEVKVIFTEEKPRSTEVKSRLTVVKPRFTECAVLFIEVLDPSGNRDSITSRGAKRPCRHDARAQKRPNAGKQLEKCCHCPGRSDNFEKMSEFTRVFLFFVATGLLPDTYAGAFREVCILFLASWETLRLKYTCTRGRFGRSSCPRRKYFMEFQ